eukprot:TRINITY_DN3447_c0_g1_i2.p1 TRINITY_DN3447_c0_g1~~TRINITY_DN3447_c0_g1_i2.p1  ORF type:complete len:269 (+),score=41.71 TRINITY_DN3447_c0_g1_i2:797-1603(+)
MTTGFVSWAWKHYLLENFSEPQLLTYGILFAHEIFYFLPYIPYLIIEYIPFFNKYRMQPDKDVTWAMRWKCVKKLLITHFLVQLPMMAIFSPFIHKSGLTAQLPLPSTPSIFSSVLFCFLIEDFYFYWVHRALHWPMWYKYIHKIHHEHAAPFGIAAEYAHPAETLILGLGTVIGPALTIRHLFTLYIWLGLRLYQTIEAHSGYDIPWLFTRYIPFWGGAHFHDFHHETFVGNYSSSFTIWDWVFGTSKQYYSRLEKRKEQGKAKKAA